MTSTHVNIQWNLSNPDTLGTISGVHLIEIWDHHNCPEYGGVLISEVQISEVPLYTPEWVQVQGLYSGHHNLIRHYMRVQKTVMHLYRPTTPFPGMGGGRLIVPVGGSFELCMHNLDSTCLFYKMVNVSHSHT